MFGLSTIKSMNRRAASRLKKKGPALKTTVQAPWESQADVVLKREAYEPKTVKQLLIWVKRSAFQTFYHDNMEKCGCLMSEHFYSFLNDRDIVVCRGGGLLSMTELQMVAQDVYPFHDEFWKPFLDAYGERNRRKGELNITKAQAIARLEEMLR